MMRKGQGTFEYVLLLGGVLLIVVLAIVVLQNTANAGFAGTAGKQCNARLLSEISCASTTEADNWNECGQINSTSFKDCGATAATSQPAGTACVAPVPGNKLCGTRPLS
ncbi:MAG TPA: class III signal peptide-containing protein [Candidatus Norongarragalinales archaeon]|nr:class III signal peptide-containing protein [Candidatus Norongarragalinales archaeon]